MVFRPPVVAFVFLVLVIATSGAIAAPPAAASTVLVPRDTTWVKDLILALVWGLFIPAVVIGPVIKYFSPPAKPERRPVR